MRIGMLESPKTQKKKKDKETEKREGMDGERERGAWKEGDKGDKGV